MNPWDVLKNNDFGIGSGNDILLGTSGSLYRVMLAVAVIGLACMTRGRSGSGCR